MLQAGHLHSGHGARKQNRSRKWILTPVIAGIAGIAGIVTSGAIAFITFEPRVQDAVPINSQTVLATPSATASTPGSLIPGDNSSFVADINYPDGSVVTEAQHFVKKWEIKNTGTVPWANRYLAAVGVHTGSCTYPFRVPIPFTPPGRLVIISVPVTAAASPGTCFVEWKMETDTGKLAFPDQIGVWVNIEIVAQK